ncbi:extracellular solute-binding protein [Paenibacillus albidus]|uniref:extracellular solute-binding protein n=1 Tax=Paenibacillus albidus TaxID=2041023 RepID=UPI001BE65869|nr:extracellular solute-binding protein [Paenibacillus albidus]MBT2288412.1 extracellular solute-binding protein [Paenibacillus albidus]
MKKNRMMGSVAAMLLLTTTVLSACGGANEGASNGNPKSTVSRTSTSASTDTVTENENLKVALWGIQDAFNTAGASDDTIFNNLQQKLNVTIEPVQITWNDWLEKLKVWAASSQLPDIFPNDLAGNLALYRTWAKQGIIKPLPDDLSPYPNIQKIMDEPSLQSFKLDGKYYMIPRMTYPSSSDWVMDRAISYRKDWAEQAGYTSSPKSFDELVAMIKAVQAQHPGVTGISLTNKPYLLTAFLGSFPEASNEKSWIKEDGKWIPAFASTRMYEGIEHLRTLYQEGLLDKDIAIQKDSDGTMKFVNGQSFMLFGQLIPTNIEPFVKANPDVKFEEAYGFMDWYPATDGQLYTFAETPFWSEIYFSNQMSDAKFDRALKLIDYMIGDEYTALVRNGIEGTDYKVENGKSVSLLPDGQTLTDKYPVTIGLGTLGSWYGGFLYSGKHVVNSNPDYAAYDQMLIDKFNDLKANAKPAPINFEVMTMSTPAKDKVATLRADAMNSLFKVVMGKDDPLEMWKKEIKALDAKGLQEAIEETTKAAVELGIE